MSCTWRRKHTRSCEEFGLDGTILIFSHTVPSSYWGLWIEINRKFRTVRIKCHILPLLAAFSIGIEAKSNVVKCSQDRLLATLLCPLFHQPFSWLATCYWSRCHKLTFLPLAAVFGLFSELFSLSMYLWMFVLLQRLQRHLEIHAASLWWALTTGCLGPIETS